MHQQNQTVTEYVATFVRQQNKKSVSVEQRVLKRQKKTCVINTVFPGENEI